MRILLSRVKDTRAAWRGIDDRASGVGVGFQAVLGAEIRR
jgi:hypothetical protein